MTKVHFRDTWFGPDSNRYRPGIQEVPPQFCGRKDDGSFKHLPKTAKIVGDNYVPPAPKAPQKKLLKDFDMDRWQAEAEDSAMRKAEKTVEDRVVHSMAEMENHFRSVIDGLRGEIAELKGAKAAPGEPVAASTVEAAGDPALNKPVDTELDEGGPLDDDQQSKLEEFRAALAAEKAERDADADVATPGKRKRAS